MRRVDRIIFCLISPIIYKCENDGDYFEFYYKYLKFKNILKIFCERIMPNVVNDRIFCVNFDLIFENRVENIKG